MTKGASETPIDWTRRDFSRFFARKYWRLLKAALNRSERRPDYADPDVINAIAAPYREVASRPASPLASNFPKNIFMLWQQGWDDAPPLVRACAKSWQDKNPGWTVHLVDETSLQSFAPDYGSISAPHAARTAKSNLARLSLLEAHGGVWADATLYCQVPLDDWLGHAVASGFFMFAAPRPYRYSDIWFLAATAGSPAIEKWLEQSASYWSFFSRPHHYYWMEYLFELLAERDEEVMDIWRRTTKLSALGPLVTQGLPFDQNAPQATFDLIEEGIVPVHKLSHKWRFASDLKGTPVGSLTGLPKL